MTPFKTIIRLKTGKHILDKKKGETFTNLEEKQRTLDFKTLLHRLIPK